MRFNNKKCRVLHLGCGNSKYIYVLRDEQTESSPVRNNLGVLVDGKLNMTWRYALISQKANCILDEETEHILSKFAEDTLEGCDATQQDLDGPGSCTKMDLRQCNIDNCRVLKLGTSNTMHQYELRVELLESSSTEKELGDLVDEMLSMKQ